MVLVCHSTHLPCVSVMPRWSQTVVVPCGLLGPWRVLSYSGVAPVLVVPHLRLKCVHIRLHVDNPRFECSECLEQIHGGVNEHVYPDRGGLTLPEFAQCFDTRTEAFCLVGDLVDTLPRALKGALELLQRVPQRGHEVPGLVLLGHRRSLPSCSGV